MRRLPVSLQATVRRITNSTLAISDKDVKDAVEPIHKVAVELGPSEHVIVTYNDFTGDLSNLNAALRTLLAATHWHLAIGSLNYGLEMHPQDDKPTSANEVSLVLQGLHDSQARRSTTDYTIVLFCNTQEIDMVRLMMKESNPDKLCGGVETVMWHKPNYRKGAGFRMAYNYEVAALGFFSLGGKRTTQHFQENTGLAFSVMSHDTDAAYKRATDTEVLWQDQFSRGLVNEFIRHHSSVGQTVLDLFCGTGTVAAMSMMKGRNAVAFDKLPLAIATTRARIKTLTDMMASPEHKDSINVDVI